MYHDATLRENSPLTRFWQNATLPARVFIDDARETSLTAISGDRPTEFRRIIGASLPPSARAGAITRFARDIHHAIGPGAGGWLLLIVLCLEMKRGRHCQTINIRDGDRL